MNPRTTAPHRRLRRALAWVAAVGLLGSAAQAEARVALERTALESRVEAMRATLHTGHAAADAPRGLVAQWNNFKNWNNWTNWKKWLNQ
jgi:hypothetical protein